MILSHSSTHSGSLNSQEGMSCWRDCRLCAAACTSAAKFISLNAPQAGEMCRLMADVCKHCAEICEEVGWKNRKTSRMFAWFERNLINHSTPKWAASTAVTVPR